MRWDWSIRDGVCGNEKALALYVAVGNLLQDAIIVVLPMGPLLGLQMALHRKFGVCCLFGLGTMYVDSPPRPLYSPTSHLSHCDLSRKET